jgi:predicted ATPase
MEPSQPHDQLFGADKMSFRTSIIWETERPTVDLFEYEFKNQRVGMRRIAGPERNYELFHKGNEVEKILLRGRKFLTAPIKCYGFPSNALGYTKFSSFLPSLQFAFEDLFAKVHYLGPIRPYPFRVYEWGGEKPADAGWDGEQAIPAILASKTITQVAEWLKQMGLIHSFKLQPVGESRTIYQCLVKTTPTATEVLLPDVGFGVSQILPVLANCAMLSDGSTLLLEQPEIHLHPFAQAALADVLIDAIKNRHIQIVVESHSEHLLRRIQRRIAEEEFPAEDAALYFCHIENGASEADELELDAYGNIKNWPKNFFGDEMGELASMTTAAMQRQRAGTK